MEQNEKLLSIRINTLSDTSRKSGKKYYKSISESIAHMNRTESMDSDYLMRPEKQNQNIDGYIEKDLKDMVDEVLSKHQKHYHRKMPKNWKPYIDGLITFSATMQKDIDRFGTQNLFNSIKSFLADEFGKNNVIGLALHMDETTPHLHFTAINYDEKIKKAYSANMEAQIKANKGMNPLQDRLADHLKKTINGFDYVRGETYSIKDYHTKRKYQQDHIDKQEETINKQEETIKSQERKILILESSTDKMEERMIDAFNQAEMALEHAEQIKEEKTELIKSIVSQLIELGKEKDSSKFMRLVQRYTNNENNQKLDNLIQKWSNALNASQRETQGGGIKM